MLQTRISQKWDHSSENLSVGPGLPLALKKITERIFKWTKPRNRNQGKILEVDSE